MSGASVIILAHGSRGEKEPFERLKEIVRRLQDRLGPTIPVSGAALQFNHPNLEEAIEEQISQGATNVIVLPYFLFDGTHINVDIPSELAVLQEKHPGVSIKMGRTLGVEERLIEVLVDRLSETADGSIYTPAADKRRLGPQEIEDESMAIIERLLPANGWPPPEREVAKRMIHASGDPSIAGSIKMHPAAVEAGIRAIQYKRTIYTDVRMVACGISPSAKSADCEVCCLVDDPDITALAKESGRTRAETAVYKLGPQLDGCIVAIGNAPTALFALLDLIDQGVVRPALVAGIPVGFVGAAESKAELLKRDIPYITVTGSRGGSPLAAAAINALIRQARNT